MGWQDEYRDKHMTADEIIDRFIPDGSNLYIGGLCTPNVILEPIVERCSAGSLRGIQLYGTWIYGGIEFKNVQVTDEFFRYHTLFAGWNERDGLKSHCVDTLPIHYSDISNMAMAVRPDVVIVTVTPPDENGVCSIGPNGSNASVHPWCKHVVAQVNRNIPRVFGDEFDLPVSRIDAFIDQDDPILSISKPATITPTSQRIADIILDRINDGDCIQLGVGTIPDAIGQGLFNLKHLGVYSELYSDALIELQKAGAVDNSRKSFMPGVSVAGFAEQSPEAYKFIDGNPDILFKSFAWICNADNVAKNDNFVSINSALSVDVTGQVGAESLGTRQFSSTGGQVGFVTGARRAKNGRSFIAFESVAHTKGGPVSKIQTTLAPGTVVTTLRTDVQHIVTEYGCVDLSFCSVPERVRRMISIAHPDFRDQLTFEAKQAGLLY